MCAIRGALRHGPTWHRLQHFTATKLAGVDWWKGSLKTHSPHTHHHPPGPTKLSKFHHNAAHQTQISAEMLNFCPLLHTPTGRFPSPSLLLTYETFPPKYITRTDKRCLSTLTAGTLECPCNKRNVTNVHLALAAICVCFTGGIFCCDKEF